MFCVVSLESLVHIQATLQLFFDRKWAGEEISGLNGIRLSKAVTLCIELRDPVDLRPIQMIVDLSADISRGGKIQ